MCVTYTYTKDVAKLELLEKLINYGVLRCGVLRPTDLGPVIVPEFEGLAARAFC